MMSQSENFYFLMINLFNVSYMLSWVFSIKDCRRCQNLMKISVTHSAVPGLPILLFLPHFDVIRDLLLNRCNWQHGIYLLSSCHCFFFFFQIPVPLITTNQSVLRNLLHYLVIIFIQNYGMFLRKEFE